MRRIREDPPSPRELNLEISEALETGVFSALARDRDARYGQMMAFVNDLRSGHQATGGGGRPRRAPESGQAITLQRKLHQDLVGPPASQARALVSGAGSMGGQ